MKTSKYSDSQIMAILKEAEARTQVPELCWEHGMSSARFYKWRDKYGTMDAALMKRLKELVAENRRLETMYAEEGIKADIRPGRPAKKVVMPSRRKEVAQQAVAEHGVSIRLAYQSRAICERVHQRAERIIHLRLLHLFCRACRQSNWLD